MPAGTGVLGVAAGTGVPWLPGASGVPWLPAGIGVPALPVGSAVPGTVVPLRPAGAPGTAVGVADVVGVAEAAGDDDE